MKAAVFLFLIQYNFAWGAPCPSEDAEPALQVKTSIGAILELCGFEDHEASGSKGDRAFSDFSIFLRSGKDKIPQKIFESQEAETYWVRVKNKDILEIDELWFFSETPDVGLRQEISCSTSDKCEVTAPKCIYSSKKALFPKAVKNFLRKMREGKLKDDGEEALDQIFAQALVGDKDAKKFFEKAPAGLPKDLQDIYDSNKKKLSLCKVGI